MRPLSSRLVLTLGFLLCFCGGRIPASAQSWSNGYTYRRAITIDHTKVPNTDQSNFPVLISGTYPYVASTSNGGNVTSANGYDVLFTSDAAGTNLLAFERESYNPSTGTVNFWVNVPLLSHTSDTVIYLFYGNSAVTSDPSNATGTWNSNYAGVWHFPNGTTLSAADSTLNSNTATITGAAAATGQIGGAASFNGSSRIDISGPANNPMSSYTVEAWLDSAPTQPTGYGTFLSRHGDGAGNQYFLVTSAGQVYRWDGFLATQTISANTWHHVVYTYDGTTERFYIDGAAAGSNVAALSWDSNNWRFGMNTDSDHEYNGLLDEARLSNTVRSADWITTEYNSENNPATFYSIGGADSNGGSSWSNGYTYQRAITIDHTKVPNTDQSNFPVLISGTYPYLASTSNGGNVTSANGYDVLFTSDAAGTNLLAFERESYNPSTGTVNFWVNVPLLSHTSDTVIYLFYGNSAVTSDPSNATGTWNSNYAGVWHFPNGTTLSAADSTLNSNTATITGAAAATGQIGGAASFNGSSRIDISGPANNPMSSYTVEAWLDSAPTQPTGYGTFLSRHGDGAGNQYFLVTSAGQVYRWDGFLATQTISANTWHHVVYTYDGTTERFYIDGAAAGSNVAALSWDSNNWRFGMNTDSDHEYNGLLDEARLSNTVRSADWITTEYNSENNPAIFYSIGTADSSSGTSGSPLISNLSPASGVIGSLVTIAGINFGTTQGSSTVTFNNVTAGVSNWNTTSITVVVPLGAISGNVVVTVSGMPSNDVNFTVSSGSSSWPNGYTYQRAITVDHTKVPNTDQSNFPVLISGTYPYLASTSNGGNVTSANGYDVLFTSDAAGTNLLAFERESYNPSTGTVNFWVNVPLLSHTSDTVIYLFYGNSAVTSDPSNATGTWNSNYAGVWHFPNGTTLSAADSTLNNNTATITGAAAATGQIGGAASFNGSSRIDISGPANNPMPSYTVETWLDPAPTQPTGYGTFLSRHGDGAGNQYFLVTSAGQVNRWDGFPATQTISPNTWHHVVYTYDGTTERFYIDGAAAGSNVAALTWDSNNWRFGMNTDSDHEYNGLLDEARISNTVRSADWITTEYNSQNSPATFYSIGPADSGGTSGSPLITNLFPASGAAGGPVVITGVNFGTTGTVTFNGVMAGVSNWNPDSITVTVPPGATSGNVVVTVSGTPSNGVNFTVSSVSSTWWNSYTYRRAITIDHTKVPNTDQVKFPVLISGTYPYLATTSNGGNVTSVSGYDILFTSDATGFNALAFERESYDPSTGTVNFWVNLPLLSHTADTVIYLFYGNSTVITDQSDPNGTWDSNYTGVWHLPSLPNSTTLACCDITFDPTIYNNIATINGATVVTGKIGGGASFNGNSSIDVAGQVDNPATSYTLETWLNMNATQPTGNGTFLSRHGSGNGNQEFQVTSSGTVYRWNGFPATQTISANAWHHVVYTYDGTTERFFIDGAAAGSNVTALTWDPNNWRLGMNTDGTDGYSGLMDEVRISNTARSADRITTEYNSENAPSTFYSIGSAASNGGTATPLITNLLPASGAVGDPVVITGVNFGSTQGSSMVTFSGVMAGVTNWSSESITALVPPGATSGDVVVTISGAPSNGVDFTVTSVSSTWPNSYTYRRAITIDHTKVPNTDQTNFPVLISGTYPYLATTGNGGNVTSVSGYDILFTSDATGFNALAFERESYDPSTGTVNFWVNLPLLSHTADTVIYLFYGNSTVITDQSDPDGTWDSNYRGVFHLANGVTLSLDDPTIYNNIATINGATVVTGKIGGGASFNGNSSIDVAGQVDNPATSYTVETWLNMNATQPTGNGTFLSRHGSGNGNQEFQVTSSGTVYRWNGFLATQTISANAWHHVVYTYDGTTERFFIDGAAAGSNVAALTWDPNNWRLGMNTDGTDGYSGLMDEVRISNTARSADRITTEYNSENAPSTFYSIGSAGSQITYLTADLSNLAFGNVYVGTSIALQVTLTNTSNFNISVSNIVVSGLGFAAANWPAGRIIVPGESATLNVFFSPPADLIFAGSISVFSSAANSPATISVSGTGVDPHSVLLTWDASPPSVVGYYVYRSTVEGGFYRRMASTLTLTNTYTDANVEPGQTYYYVVTSVGSNNTESQFSNEASASLP